VFVAPITFAGGVVSVCTEAALRTAMNGGGTVTFACDGTITLARTITNIVDTILDASGHQIKISGGDAGRVLYIRSNTTFVVNHLTIAHGRSSSGAGIFNDHGTVYATNTTFYRNSILGTAAQYQEPAESATGGAVANSGEMTLVNCSLFGNSAAGGAGNTPGGGAPGVPGGPGAGGAIWNGGTLNAVGCTLATNLAAGGAGGDGSSIPMPWPMPGSAGGSGGDGAGGALFNSGTARLVNCTLGFNTGTGGAGGQGGQGYPNPDYPPPSPGPNGSPGLGVGGIYDASGKCFLTNCTTAFNSGIGIWTPGAAMLNTLLTENSPGGNCLGEITDLGHNLSSDVSCRFTNAGSMNNTYPLLGLLTNNGGPTATIALLPGSWAIDAGDTAAAPSMDQRGVPRPFGLAADIGAYEYNSSANPAPAKVLTECTEAALRAAMSGGGIVTFGCEGTITLSDTILITTNTVLEALGHQVSVSGGGKHMVFRVSPNVTFALADLTIAHGNADSGAGILNAGGWVKATRCVFSGNLASTVGGAIRNELGQLELTSCVFTNNHAWGRSAGLTGDSASGGAVENDGTLAADLCTFTANGAAGAGGLSPAGPNQYGVPGGSGGLGAGGAIRNSGTMLIFRSTFTNNSALGGTGANGVGGHHGDPGMNGGDGSGGGSGGGGEGGAIYNTGNARVASTTFAFNSGMGGSGGAGGYGGPAYGSGVGGNGGGGGPGGNGVGAIFNAGGLELINSTLADNSGSGGNGETGGAGGIGNRGGNGGQGGIGGSGFGAISDQSSCGLTNCTLALNSGTGGSGGTGGSAGIGTYQSGSPGNSGVPGLSGGGIVTTGGRMVNTLLSENAPGGNGFGLLTDLGHNLSSDGTCGFTNSHSLNNALAFLGPLTNNGGPTLTMALLPGSLAIDAGDTSAAPASDQRGFPRPAGAAADIGALESGSTMPILSIARSSATVVNMLVQGNSNQWCRLLASSNLTSWIPIATNRIGVNGTLLLQKDCGPGPSSQWYRIGMP
jgi:hypothetical protein